jgi:hypothetical protein
VTVHEKRGRQPRPGAPRPPQVPTRVRLREAAAEGTYDKPYDHTRWADHVQRVDASAAFVRDHLTVRPKVIGDLSCGDGAIPLRLADYYGQVGPRPKLVLGDLVGSWPIVGPIEDTVIGLEPVDLYICSETVEHIATPDEVLADLSVRADWLFLSTPIDEWDPNRNPEHLWGWNVEYVEHMLTAAGWARSAHVLYTPPASAFYTFQFWLAFSTRREIDREPLW